MSNRKEEAMKMKIKIIRKEILFLKGRKREREKKAYYRLLHKCGGTCGLEELIYLILTE